MKRSSLLMLLALAPLNLGWGFVINGPVAGTQTLSGIGATGEITPTGSITTVGGDAGVVMEDDNQTLTNEGLISTTGVNARGVLNNGGDNSTIENRGTIEITGAGGFLMIGQGINSLQGQGALITNSGSIVSSAVRVTGISNNDSQGALITNSGSIFGTGDGFRGIANLTSDNSIIQNSGTIVNEGNVYTSFIEPNVLPIGILNDSLGVNITNSGLILTTGNSGGGIENSGNQAVITNSGLIQTSGSVAHAISNTSSQNVTITNSGSIETLGEGANGIFNNLSQNVTITNSGSIETAGLEAFGISNLFSSGVDITNSGSILTSGDTASGILNLDSLDAEITNSGLIQTSGEGSHAISNVSSDSVTIFNTGHLLAQGADSDGIFSTGANLEITNGGTIESQQGFALNLSGDNPTLTSLACSKIIGPVFSEELLNFNVPNPFNMILTLTEDSAGFGEVSINGPFFQSGNTIAIFDANSLGTHAAATVDIVADLSDTLLNSLSNPCYVCCTKAGTTLWVQGVGSIRERGSLFEGYRYRQGGVLGGLTFNCFAGGTLRIFEGAVFGKTSSSQNGCTGNSDLDTTTYVGGFSYEKLTCNGCFMFGLYAGNLKIDQKRDFYDNLAPNGVVETKQRNSGFFVSPEASFRQRFAIQDRAVSITGALRYAGFFPGDYKESFSNQELKVDKHGASLLTARLLLGLPLSCTIGANCFNVEPYLGGAGRFQFSSKNFSGTFFNEPIFYSSGLNRNILSFLYGLKACYIVCNLDFYASFEGDFENEKDHRYIGSAGIAYRF